MAMAKLIETASIMAATIKTNEDRDKQQSTGCRHNKAGRSNQDLSFKNSSQLIIVFTF